MSALGKGSLSIRKKDLQSQRDIGLSFKILRMWHKATLGDSSINLVSLVFPSTELPGATNPTASEILAAKAYINKNSVTISSSHKPFINRLSYDIASSSTINFNGWTAEDGEIFEITINPAPTTGLKTVDASPLIKTGTLTAGNTQFIVGTAFPLNKYPNEQVGAVLVYIDGELQARNTANAAASPSADGNYHEDDAGGAVSNSITFNKPYAVDVNVIVISNGLIVSNPSDSRDQVVDTLATQVDVMAADLAQVTGNAITRYQAQPNAVDLSAFGNRVFSLETSRTADEAEIDALQNSNIKVNCRYSSANGQAFNASVNIYKFELVSFDTHSAYNVSTGLFTVPVAGKYQISALITASSATIPATGALALDVYKNSSQYSNLNAAYGNGSAIYARAAGTDIVQCAAGDTLSIRHNCNTTSGTFYTNALYNYVNIVRIGD